MLHYFLLVDVENTPFWEICELHLSVKLMCEYGEVLIS